MSGASGKLLAALAVVALIGAGCSSGGGGADKQSGDGIKFAACMRDNGVKQFPDPPASGKLTIDGVLNGSSLDPNTPAWKSALAACKDLQPAGFTGTKATVTQQKARLRFAQCIRDNGVRDFPDPARDAPLVNTNLIPSASTDAGMSILNAAMQKCGGIAAQAGAGSR